ncbi:MAG: hypothetical protein M3Q40_08260 [Pseudomonadota bacterium]|nr:hypothetical protein [Pseudomonadota bacterium]
MQGTSRRVFLPAIAATALALASANPLLTVGALALLAVVVRLLWRPGEPPALLYAMGYHWMQASILLLYADMDGRVLDSLGYGPMVETATWLTFAGILVVALGMRLGAGRNHGQLAQRSVVAIASQLSIRRLFVASLGAIVLTVVASRLAYVVSGLVQPILALALLRWVVVFLFTYVVLARHSGYLLLAVVFGVEILIGFLGFFSDFKTVLIVMLLAALTSPSALRGIRLRAAGGLVLLILVLGIVWTGVKSDYRAFLNQGTGQQVVLVPVGERVAKLGQLITSMTPASFGDSVVTLVERVTYVYYFGQALETVPRDLAHEQGLLWREAVQGAVVPRLLNPAKRIIDDSERTSYYTGNRVAGADQGTSISLGYMAESYIDFGPVGMMFPLFVWGLFVGLLYRSLIRATRYPLLGFACAAVLVALRVSELEQSNLKMVGATLLAFLVLFFAQKLVAGRGLRLAALPSARGGIPSG